MRTDLHNFGVATILRKPIFEVEINMDRYIICNQLYMMKETVCNRDIQ